ncbi:hypothetical protein [Streptomyces sp. NPDC051079]|uniref:DUF6197 family protein n=1 Tax=Streptomyces sp. NPDC051079 TaxID=3155043 RepID=UPI00344D5806
MSITLPTNIPSGERRTVRVDFTPARPSTVPAVLLGAARIIQANGLWQGDYVPDAFDREISAAEVPHAHRPMSIVAALRCAATGNPHLHPVLVDEAICFLAVRLEVDGEGPEYGDIFALEQHVDDWTDVPGRTADEAVALLEMVATAPECAA